MKNHPLLAQLMARLLACACLSATAADDAWRRDHDALQQGLARHYATFQDLLTERRLDLPALVARDRAALAAARSDAERRRVFEKLLADLRDPHVSIVWPPPDAAGGALAVAGAAAAAVAEPVCDAGIWARATVPGIAFARLPGWTALSDAAPRLFHAGLLTVPDASPVGVLRLPIFIESAYEPACRHAAAVLQRSPSDACDSDCAERRDALSAGYLNVALRATLDALQAAGARRIVVDVTQNGGGSDWSEAVARILAGRMQSARIAPLRHPAWLAWVDRQLRKATPNEALTLQRLRAQLTQACDLSAAWSDSALATGQRELPCSTLVDVDLYTQGLSPEPSGQAASPATALPLWVLVDNNTHSAAEQFAALLQDHGRATVLGAVTAGAGCGHYTGGDGTAFMLPASGARVVVPDCVRLRADGSNERRGVVPDRLLPWAPSDSGWQRAAKAAAAVLPAASGPQAVRPSATDAATF
jgi:hypothetical protein